MSDLFQSLAVLVAPGTCLRSDWASPALANASRFAPVRQRKSVTPLHATGRLLSQAALVVLGALIPIVAIALVAEHAGAESALPPRAEICVYDAAAAAHLVRPACGARSVADYREQAARTRRLASLQLNWAERDLLITIADADEQIAADLENDAAAPRKPLP